MAGNCRVAAGYEHTLKSHRTSRQLIRERHKQGLALSVPHGSIAHESVHDHGGRTIGARPRRHDL